MNVRGYEYGVSCPECDYYTRLGNRDKDVVECGEYPGVGCGRLLRIKVEVVDGGDA